MIIEKSQRLLGMLGFAMRAGKIIIGTEQICKAMAKKPTPLLVLISQNASDATKKKLGTKCEFYGIKSLEIGINTDELGALLGKTYTPAAVALCDEGFAKEIEKLS